MRMILLAALLVVMAVGALGAQTLMPLPAYSSTYSYSGHTRGYHFQAPAPFTIVGIMVPDEKFHGKQNVAVWHSNGKPPTYSATSTSGLRFISIGQPSSLWLNCHIPFNQGDHVAILGACGDATIMHNSYGSGGYVTSLFGGTTTLYRLITQNNMVSLHLSKQPIPYSDNGTGSVGRVKIAVVMSPDLQGTGTGTVGSVMSFTLTSPADAGLAYQMGTSLTTGPIVLGSRRLYLGIHGVLVASLGGTLPTVFGGYSGTLGKGGTAAAKLTLPNIPALKGVTLYTAYVTLRAASPQGINAISGTHQLLIK